MSLRYLEALFGAAFEPVRSLGAGGPDEVCLSDDLCWPLNCQGDCQGTYPDNCCCEWTCNDGSSYAAECEAGSAGYGCACIVDGIETQCCCTPSGSFTCEIPMCCFPELP